MTVTPSLTHVQLTKLSAEVTFPGALPVPYWSRGHLTEPLAVGRPILMSRYARAGREAGEPEVVECAGLFESSPVVSLTPQEDGSIIAATQNSHWKVAPLESAQSIAPAA